jgi:hypothetical protein
MIGLASAAGGMVVDHDQLAMVHEKEMVLPKDISGGLLGLIAKGGGQKGGDTNISIAPHTVVQHRDLEQMIREMPHAIVGHLKQAHRDGKLGFLNDG